MRPTTLAAVAQQTIAGGSFDRSLANFLDAFYASPSEQALCGEPELLQPHQGELGRVRDAYLAAAAEELARPYDLPCPNWVADSRRKLREPWFASPLAALRAILIAESPAAFRSRNLFISANGLTRV